jgi:hypothetical protein
VVTARAHALISRIRASLAAERGSVIVIVAVLLPVFLAGAAYAVDLGTLRVAREQAQMAADAGALAGAGDNLDGTVASATATTDANTFVQADDKNATATVTTPFNSDPDAVKVVVSKDVPLTFARFFGINDRSVSATAVASSDLGSPLAYFGSDDSDLQDGSATSDGWDNFCAYNDNDHESNSTPGSDDPPRCPATAEPENTTLDGWDLAHGGIDISKANFFSPPGTSDQMVDLTGTCVELNGSYPSPHSGSTSITLNGATTANDGYCENNADGEIEEPLDTVAGQQYTVNFWLGSNTWGYPYEKSLMMLASTQDLNTLPPVADTDGGSPYQSGNTSEPNGTVYPLETDSRWPTYGGALVGEQEFFYYGPAGNATDPVWQSEKFVFTATTSKTYLGFGGLTNCVPDWFASSKMNDGYFYPSSIASDSPGSVSGAASSSSFVAPPAEVYDDVQSPSYTNQCKYGAGISDIAIVGTGSVALTQ